MHRPCATRSSVKVVRSGALANNAVGIASSRRLTRMPKRRSMREEKKPIARPEIAMPKADAFEAKPIAAGETP